MMYEKLPANGVRICIDQKGTDIAGKAYSPLLNEEIIFNGFSELLLILDKLFDQCGYPESFQEKRSFQKKKSPSATYHGMPEVLLSTEEIRKHTGALETLEVIVNSRRNTSWQGRVMDVDSDWQIEFGSEVDLFSGIMEK